MLGGGKLDKSTPIIDAEETLDERAGESSGEDINAAYEIIRPPEQLIPFVFASPHSGTHYSDSFIDASRLDPIALRGSEDSFVDDLYSEVPNCGAPLLKALFPRAFVDPNREAYELDPKMFEDRLPRYVNTSSPRVFAGLGTIPRVVTNGDEIYDNKITFAEGKKRIEIYYFPYHAALQRLIDETKKLFGKCFLIDCHSMPSIGGPMDNDKGNQRVDVVLGNKFGEACSPGLINFVEEYFKALGMIVRRNQPYAGGYTTRHYGSPENSVHALQIEINRALYMNEKSITRNAGYEGLKTKISNLLMALAEADLVL
ncbi:MAG: N-formylglutamate amidohydrolase [Rhodospirillaceae bacterium]|nr:N-formylglutamate amidohydrolase [Rhodospirillaceae bacterium]MBT7953597.1 N-formylglutamate amidohydrolase [Rhodospirillaceae bacterium]